MKIIGIIPSRYAASRFPGKPLADISGKTMIRRVYEQASKSKSLSQLIVATDDQRIYDEVKSFGGEVLMTSAKHKNGTERYAEIASDVKTDVIINIQGDEPFIQPEQIDLAASCFSKNDEVQIATLIKAHSLDAELQKSSRIKVVVNNNMQALYFSRVVIPFCNDQESMIHHQFWKHIGIYGYRKNVLLEIVGLPESALEKAESLEQLRWLENGYTIQCEVTEHESISIDTPEDLIAISEKKFPDA